MAEIAACAWPGFQSPSVSPLAIRAWHPLKACKTDGYLLTSDPRARPRNIFHVYTADLKGNQEHVRNFTSSQEVFTKYCSAVSTCTLALPFTTHMERGGKKHHKMSTANIKFVAQNFFFIWVNFTLFAGLD